MAAAIILEAIWFAICISLHGLAGRKQSRPASTTVIQAEATRYINHRSTVPITEPINSILRPWPRNGQFRVGMRRGQYDKTSWPRVVAGLKSFLNTQFRK